MWVYVVAGQANKHFSTISWYYLSFQSLSPYGENPRSTEMNPFFLDFFCFIPQSPWLCQLVLLSLYGVQGFHNSRCKRTDALVVRPGRRVCFALMAQSHGPTNSLKISFSNRCALALTSAWTRALDFHLFLFLCWLRSDSCMKCQESLVFAEIIPKFFFCSCWWGLGWL